MCNHVTLPERLQPSLPLSQLSTQPSVHAISTSQTPVDRNRAVRPNLFWCRCRIMTSHMGYEGTKKSRLGEWFALKSRNLIALYMKTRRPKYLRIHSRDCPGVFCFEKWSFCWYFRSQKNTPRRDDSPDMGLLLSHRPTFGISPSASGALFVERTMRRSSRPLATPQCADAVT